MISMSRKYKLEISVWIVTRNESDKIKDIINKERTITNDDYYSFYNKQSNIIFETTLCGGQTEQQTHNKITNNIRKKYPKVKIQTNWTYLEDLPFNTYGSY